MARPRKAPTEQQRITRFAQRELEVLVDILVARVRGVPGPNPTAPDVLGALVIAARALPPDVIEALLPAYEERERAELAAEDTTEPDS
jgi:hypothetical protein